MKNVNILIVEKTEILREIIYSNLKFYNKDLVFNISKAETAIEAQDLIKKSFYELIILGLDLGTNTYLELSKWIREQKLGSFPFIIILSKDNSRESIKNLLEAECDDYILVPINKYDFELRINVSLHSINHRKKRKDAEHKLLEDEKRREIVLNALNLGVLLLDKDNKILYFNTPMQNFFSGTLMQDTKIDSYIKLNKNNFLLWLNSPKDKFVVEAEHKWLELEAYNDNNNRLIYAMDITELMTLRLSNYNKPQLIGESKIFKNILSQIDLLAYGEWNVLITGETGTGKELCAQQLHLKSKRSNEKLITVNCAGLNENLITSALFGHRKGSFTGAVDNQIGFFEAAKGGTLFLDEIGDISKSVQTLLLRAIEQKEIIRIGDTTPIKIDVRIITATNKNLLDELHAGNFRSDLYYRINESEIKMPSLTERLEDIPLLIDYYLKQIKIKYPELNNKISNECLKFLLNYSWPGNIRELRSVLQYAAIQAEGKIITMEALPDYIHKNFKSSEKNLITKNELVKMINKMGGNISKSAKALNISRATIYRIMKKYSIK